MTHHTQRFEQAYIEALYFFADAGPDDDIPCDAELSPEARATIKADCARFLELFGADIQAMIDAKVPLVQDDSGFFVQQAESAIWEQAGHDFWLTRNGHGVGFWDRPELYGQDLADKLSEAVGWRTDFPEIYAYLGDDGLIHLA